MKYPPFFLISLIATLAACSSAEPKPDPTDRCEADEESCAGACVDISSDPAHCGDCERACEPTESCSQGVCEPAEEPCAEGACEPVDPCSEGACEPVDPCSEGACEEPVCAIDAATYEAGAIDPLNACMECAPETSSTAWSPRLDGSACGSAQICGAGACSAGCFIDGAFYAADAVNSDNECEQCRPETSTSAWTARESIPLFLGGLDHTEQGWTTVSQAPSTLSLGEDYTQLETSTPAGGRTSGQLLLVKTGVVEPGEAFAIRAELQVVSVSAHNALDSGAAFLGAFTAPFGNAKDRAQMVYLDSAAIGWSDDTQSAALAVTNGTYRSYVLSVDASGVAVVSVDGVPLLTRNNFVTDGGIAFGDQSNDPNVDGVLRIRSVEKLCL